MQPPEKRCDNLRFAQLIGNAQCCVRLLVKLREEDWEKDEDCELMIVSGLRGPQPLLPAGINLYCFSNEIAKILQPKFKAFGSGTRIRVSTHS